MGFDHNLVHWLQAVLYTQETGKLDKLAVMFRSNFEIKDSERKLLAALCDRGQFKKKPGHQLTPIGKMSLKARRAMLASQVRRLQSGEDRLIEELTVKEIKEKFGMGMKVEVGAMHWDQNARKLKKLRDAKGRMSHSDAIRLIAERNGVGLNTLADYVDRRSGSSRGGWKRWPKKVAEVRPIASRPS